MKFICCDFFCKKSRTKVNLVGDENKSRETCKKPVVKKGATLISILKFSERESLRILFPNAIVEYFRQESF